MIMPEGPEVECTKIGLKRIEGKKIKEIKLTELSQKYPKYKNKQKEFDKFTNSTIKEIKRIGKFLIWIFDCKQTILNHLGMSGKWIYINSNRSLPNHTKVIVTSDRYKLVFDDVRNFGQFRIFDSLQEVLNYNPIRKMGIDGLEKPFPIERFIEEINKKQYLNKEIASVLLNQKLVAGIGNIYRSETLFQAKISPLRKVKNLSKQEKIRLGGSISYVLNKALECKGSTFSIQPFITPDGNEGHAQNWHNVYAKENERCKICNKKIERLKWEGRSLFYCPNCQK